MYALVFLALVQYVIAESSCPHENSPKKSTCTGCPPRDRETGLLCASTTRYNDHTKGACGCGTEPNPTSYWTKSLYTAAMNAKSLDVENPLLAWCPHNCGQCYQICSTGGTTSGKETKRGDCIVVQIENRCGDGYKADHEAQWCRQELSWEECAKNPGLCKKEKATNDYGYPAHFDLQDAGLQISSKYQWDNIEVTFEPVSCSEGVGFPDWNENCYCPLPGSDGKPNVIPQNNKPAKNPSPPKNNPPRRPRPSAPTSGDCAGVKYFQQFNEWWVPIVAPKSNDFSLKCSSGQVATCKWTDNDWMAGYQCNFGQPCKSHSHIVVIGNKECRLNGGSQMHQANDNEALDEDFAEDEAQLDENSAEDELAEDEDVSEGSSSDVPHWAIALLAVGSLMVVLVAVLVVMKLRN